MIDKKIGIRCTGCTACENVCPKGAIKMQSNQEGFWYPLVDYNRCVQCGICTRTCPIIGKSEKKAYREPEVYAAWNLDEKIRINSTSGGIFSALAKAFIAHGGIVVGAQYDKQFNVSHVMVSNLSGMPKLRQSKYAQSNLGQIFKKIKENLEQEHLVLFCGTPCQSAGLQAYLHKNYSNLYCCDFICRGVISPKVYQKFLSDIGQEHGSDISAVQFKNKDYGWNGFSTKLTFADGSIYQKNRSEDYYMRGYLKHNLYLRPSCHQCHYKSFPRISDLSLGDFWGIGNYDIGLDDDKGTSVVLVNSEKGQKLLEWMKKDIFMEQRTLEEVLSGNSCLLNSAPEGEFRSYFFDHMERMSFQRLIDKIERKAEHLSIAQRVLRALHNIKLTLTKK